MSEIMIASGHCPGEWLAHLLRHGPLLGSWALLYDPRTGDVVPVREWLDLWSMEYCVEQPGAGPS